MAAKPPKRLTRALHPMPAFVRAALNEKTLMAAYKARPPYQQNDYLGWINQAKQPATKEKRLAQMLAELESGDAYMNMAYKARKA